MNKIPKEAYVMSAEDIFKRMDLLLDKGIDQMESDEDKICVLDLCINQMEYYLKAFNGKKGDIEHDR